MKELNSVEFLIARIDELDKAIQRQAKIIQLLKQSNEFYADKDNWDNNGLHFQNYAYNRKDSGYLSKDDDETIKFGGKLARKIKQQVEEIESETKRPC